MSLRTDFEIAAARIRYEPHHERRLPGHFKPRTAIYHHFVLPDASGFDIRGGHGTAVTSPAG